jgi:hypothetical protein
VGVLLAPQAEIKRARSKKGSRCFIMGWTIPLQRSSAGRIGGSKIDKNRVRVNLGREALALVLPFPARV